jgi:hypothetical protein
MLSPFPYIFACLSLSLLFRQSLLYDSQFNISIRTRLISTMQMVMMAMVMIAIVMMAIAMVSVMVVTVLEALRQLGWLRQRQHQSFHRLRAFY